MLAVTAFSDEAEALRLANLHEFGLAAAVLSADEARCARFVRGFEAGVCWINASQAIFTQARACSGGTGVGMIVGPARL